VVWRLAFSVGRSALGVQRWAFSVGRSALGVQRWAFSVGQDFPEGSGQAALLNFGFSIVIIPMGINSY